MAVNTVLLKNSNESGVSLKTTIKPGGKDYLTSV
mgnify:CR=1 FL=1